jgi:predicted phage tail protein
MTEEKNILRGAGGGPKPPPQPYRAPDTLHSRSFASLLDLISEGEIEGFASASREGLTKGSTAYDNASLKDVFLDDTPVLDANANSTNPAESDFNFKDVIFRSRFGTSNQSFVSGFPDESSSPTGVNTTVENGSPVTRQIPNSSDNPDAVVVTLTWPQIQVAEDDGDLRGDTVAYKILTKFQGESNFTTRVETSVSGRTADAYARDHRINLNGNFPVDIRVERVTADSTSSNRQNSFQFTSFQEIRDNTNNYPNSAYVALRLDSKQFSNIPSRKYRIRGIKVRIPASNGGISPTVDANGRINYPSNYVFAGDMGAAVWTTCPAMILLDLLVTKRYGFGDHISPDQSTDAKIYENIDLFSFFNASKYSNAEVDDGTGSGAKEARFACNVNIQTPKEAFTVINELAGVMRCMPIWSNGNFSLAQDKETSPSYLFNFGNVGEDGFSYSGSSLKQRHSVVSVSYFNMDSREVDYEVVEDSTAIAKLGVLIKKVKAFACTSRNQAARLGRAILFAEQHESETVTFSTSIDSGSIVRPGGVIAINDPVRAGKRRGGRIVAATSNTITIDAVDVTDIPDLNDNPKVSVILSNGNVEERNITLVTGAVLTVSSNFTTTPNVNSPYLLSSTSLQTQLFRVLSVEEQDETNYTISALAYREGKYNFIENNQALTPRVVSILNAPAVPPSNLTVTEKIIPINNIARSKLIIDWQPVEGVTQYLISYKLENGNFINAITFSSDYEILDTVKGLYEFRVFSYNAALTLSANFTSTTFTAQGKTAVPEDVTGLTIEPINEQFVRLRFDQALALDVLHGGRVYVRHTNKTGTAATFQAAQDIVEAVAGNSTEVIAPALAGTYLLKFQDDGKRFSANATKVAISEVQIIDFITVKTDREDTDTTPFNGTKNNTVFDNSIGGLKLVSNAINAPATKATGTYDFVDTLDLGGVFSLQLKRIFQGAGYYPSNLFDSRVGLVDTWTSWDGDVADEANAKLAVRTTNDNPQSSPTYGDFNNLANGSFKGRGFQFRATLETTDPAQNMNLQQLGYLATLPSRTEQSGVIASGTSAKNVTFANAFFVGTSALGNLNNFLPAVIISPQSVSGKIMATGDYYELTNVTGTGFIVHFKNSSGASIDRNFTYMAVGFGKGG